MAEGSFEIMTDIEGGVQELVLTPPCLGREFA